MGRASLSTQIKKVLLPGDYVFVIADRTIYRAKVSKVDDEGVQCGKNFLPYGGFRRDWWLTKSIAVAALESLTQEEAGA